MEASLKRTHFIIGLAKLMTMALAVNVIEALMMALSLISLPVLSLRLL